jgi:hypothetical protein
LAGNKAVETKEFFGKNTEYFKTVAFPKLPFFVVWGTFKTPSQNEELKESIPIKF